MELSRIILFVLADEKGKLRLSEFLRQILESPAFSRLILTPSNKEITHTIDVLVHDGYIIKTVSAGHDEYQLSSRGYDRLKAWYTPRKFLSLMSNDVAKMLSIVATILSIIATYVSIKMKL
jgi:DNA-binding HxlR family transcriptional regulator